MAEARLGPRQLASRARPGVSALVPQVLEVLFESLRADEAHWTRRAGAASPVPAFGPASAAPAETGVADGSFAVAFREGVSALEPILRAALRPPTLAALRAAAGGPRVNDSLWVATVCELAAAYRSTALSREHLVQASVPLYLGRVASFLGENAGASAEVVEERLEALCLEFERSRPALVELWTAATR